MSMKSYKNGRLYRHNKLVEIYFNADADLNRKSIFFIFSEKRKPYIHTSVKYFSESSPFEYGFKMNPFSCRNLLRDYLKQLTI